jgi:hypothetical protein
LPSGAIHGIVSPVTSDRRPRLVLALLLGAAALSGCASQARSVAKSSAEGTIDALRDDEVLVRFHEDLRVDPTLPGLGRRLTDGVVESVAHAIPPVDRVIDRAATRAETAWRALDLYGPARAAVRELAREAAGELRADLAPLLEEARSARLAAGAADLGRALGEGATVAGSRALGEALDSAARALASTATAEAREAVNSAVEQLASRLTRGILHEVRARLQEQTREAASSTWAAGAIAAMIGGALVLVLAIARAVAKARQAALAEEAFLLLRQAVDQNVDPARRAALERAIYEHAAFLRRGRSLVDLLGRLGIARPKRTSEDADAGAEKPPPPG